MPHNFGISGVSEPDFETLEELKREWDAAESGSVSRADVAREALALGLVALEMDEFKPAGGQYATQERKAILRQALRDHFAAEE